jgi:hypothetical protein
LRIAIVSLIVYLKRNLHTSSFPGITWFAYIGVCLIFAPCLLSANTHKKHIHVYLEARAAGLLPSDILSDTTKSVKKPGPDDKKKIKEIAKAKKQPKPEKIEPENSGKQRSKRQRRPEGMERPPEIPRRNGN